ncbi:MAG: sulfotransferase [candidate division KSB1 bacterium]|nr:sulfotransferase [candidate division KSB1 bacterium]MDZ7365076.1 sulfotransferase [candidate division KSB1 bacterium]MDZ7407256.1 sulfotransferase [candidate division KSB1 bacterium]
MSRAVVFILSHNYSGSTWLSLLLGSHSQAFYLGELNKFYSRKYPMPCALCAKRGEVCPYFYDVTEVHPSDIHNVLFERTGKQVLVDNSKRLKWSYRFLGDRSYQHKFVHLIKDPRAIYYSLSIRNRADEFGEWALRHAEIDAFLAEYDLDKLLLTYNELAGHTDEALARLCDWIGIAYEPAQKEYWRFEHHGPGENGATAAFLQNSRASEQQFYAAHRQSNFVDLRWKEKLDAEALKAIAENPEVQRLLADLRLEFSETGLQKHGS